MLAPSRSQVIYFRSVAKFAQGGPVPEVILRPTTMLLPCNQSVAVMGRSRLATATFLRLLGQIDSPDEGEILTSASMSPIANSRGLFHPHLSGIENMQLIARMYGLDLEALVLAVDEFWPVDNFWSQTVGSADFNTRIAIEAAVTAVLPFDCYLVDNAAMLDRAVFSRFIEAAEARRAGVFFASGQPGYARDYATHAIVISDYTLYSFTDVEKAIEFYEKQPK